MERKYYSIDEKTARQAHGMCSQSGYMEGFRTAKYKKLVDSAYDLADAVASERPDRADEAYSLADRYARKLAENLNAESRINLMCQPVRQSGSVNLPVKKKEHQDRAFGRNHQEYQEIQKYPENIKKILYGNDIIRPDDARAAGKLQEKLNSPQKRKDFMKAVKDYYRRHKTLDGCPELPQGY